MWCSRPMLIAAAALAASQMTPPEEALARQLRAAIWGDLQSNALIGNGNELAARWANAHVEGTDVPQLHIQDLLCAGGPRRLRCQFGLFREGGVAFYLGKPVPDRLMCRTTFRRTRADAGWRIPRLPPGPDGGHSRITIKCKPVG